MKITIITDATATDNSDQEALRFRSTAKKIWRFILAAFFGRQGV